MAPVWTFEESGPAANGNELVIRRGSAPLQVEAAVEAHATTRPVQKSTDALNLTKRDCSTEVGTSHCPFGFAAEMGVNAGL